eukprot:Amastigsp_a342470_10.p2 type:complete len:215 gc:universal Amastigsp_a342470_10:1434-790(-)
MLATLEVGEGDARRGCGADDVEQLAQQIVEENDLDEESVHACRLLLVEVLDLVDRDGAVAVHVHETEPVLDCRGRRLVLLREEEKDKVLKAESVLHAGAELDSRLVEDACNDARRESVRVVLREILAREKQIVVRVELPKLAVEHVKVVVREERSEHVRVSLAIEGGELLEKRRAAEMLQREPPRPRAVCVVEHARNDGLDVACLELGRRAEKI